LKHFEDTKLRKSDATV